MIRVVHVKNILESPNAADTILMEWRPGMRIADCAPAGFNVNGGHAVIANYRAVTGEEMERLFVLDGDEIVFGEIPGIVEALVITATSSTATILTVAIIDAIILSAISIGISYGIRALTAPTQRIRQQPEESPSRSWEGIQDTAGTGRPIPIIYGKVRVGGQFVQSFEKLIAGSGAGDGVTTLYTLLGIGLGPLKSISGIEINGNPIADIQDVTYESRRGTPDQSQIEGFGDVVREIILERPILRSDGTLTFVTQRPVEALEITFRFPSGLLRSSKKGGLIQYDVVFSYDVREHGFGSGIIVAAGSKTITGATRNPIKGQLRIDGLRLGFYRINIRRETPDDSDQGKSLTFSSASDVYAISEITHEAYAHPGIAMIGFRQLPSVQINGAVPTNYTFLVEGREDIRVYSDVNNFTVVFSRNPAWCAAHMITLKDGGLGDKYDWDSIDIPAFIAFAAYCDAQVPDGKGGFEVRARFDHAFDTVEPTDDQVQVFGAGCGAMIVKRGSKWTVILDREDAMIWQGNEGNIMPGTLKYSFLPARSLANRITIAFANEERDYERDTYPDELPDIAPGFPYIDADRALWGVTRPSQVAREVRRLLLHNKLERAQVELEAPLGALRMYAGAIFGVATKCAGIGIASGRLLAVDANLTLLRLDEEVTIETGKTYEITIHHASGDAITTKRVVNSPGLTEEVFAQDASWNGAIAAGDTYSLGELSSSIEKFRCVECTLDSSWRRKIRGLRYDPAVYTLDLTVLQTTIASGLPDPRLFPPNPTQLLLTERLDVRPDGTLENVIDVDWIQPVSAILDHYEIWTRASDVTGWDLAGSTAVAHFTVHGVLAGFSYVVAVVPVSANGIKKTPDQSVSAVVEVTVQTLQPPNLTNLRAAIVDGTLVITVDAIAETDLGAGGHYEFRRGSSWNQSSLIARSRNPRIEIRSYSRGTTTILARAVNSLGNKSPNAASTSITLYGQIEENIVLTQNEFPTWPGTREGFTIEGGTDKLSLLQPAASVFLPRARGRTRRSARQLFRGVPPPTPITVPEGLYTTGTITVSGGSTVKARADVQVEFEAIFIGLGTFASATFPFSDPKADIPFSGEESDKVTVMVESRWSTTTTAESAFTAWAEHSDRAELDMKYIQFRVRAATASSAYSAKIAKMLISIDLPDKVVSGQHTQGTAVAFTINYPASYFVSVKRLLHMLFNGANGDYVKVTAQSATGFTAEIHDAAHALTTGTIHYEARGY